MAENYRGYQIELRIDYLGFSEAVVRQAPDPEEILVFSGIEDEDTLASVKRIIDDWHNSP